MCSLCRRVDNNSARRGSETCWIGCPVWVERFRLHVWCTLTFPNNIEMNEIDYRSYSTYRISG